MFISIAISTHPVWYLHDINVKFTLTIYQISTCLTVLDHCVKSYIFINKNGILAVKDMSSLYKAYVVIIYIYILYPWMLEKLDLYVYFEIILFLFYQKSDLVGYLRQTHTDVWPKINMVNRPWSLNTYIHNVRTK
jgi:hypothetical protein